MRWVQEIGVATWRMTPEGLEVKVPDRHRHGGLKTMLLTNPEEIAAFEALAALRPGQRASFIQAFFCRACGDIDPHCPCERDD